MSNYTEILKTALTDIMEKWFGSSQPDGPVGFLESRGYVVRVDWRWDPPARYHTVRSEEESCLLFLIHVWQYSGLVGWDGKLGR